MSIEEFKYPENLKKLTPNQLWLLQHQITAFWHGFGLSGSLLIPVEQTSRFRFKNDDQEYVMVNTDFMVQQLKEYNKWLSNYKSSWEEQKTYPCYPLNFEEFLIDEKQVHFETRGIILQMIALLQD